MLPRHHPDGIRIAFDDPRLVANAGLVLPATLALHLGRPQLVDRPLDLGRELPARAWAAGADPGDAPQDPGGPGDHRQVTAGTLAEGAPLRVDPGPGAVPGVSR